ncbi:ABC transporter permease [Rhodovulum visakhapatnamense]|uniref:Putative ABC transport system permease protein n=1 Tax=Rhodovulum visakhapatnamense TaxID=364297 RepID=A0A4R8G1P6_9RHOB|nr:ABC transporter permease [Rhodovulum visakhapatnamense]TDX33617.1 putative ABC transport system permease protein [Rhodovulum visakhapatnamense]
MTLLVTLALRALFRDWIFVFCNVAVLAGVIVPLLVLYGVRNGVYDALIGDLMANPATLQIDTAGNQSFTPADLAEVQGWEDVRFATLKTRSLFDYVNVRATGGRGRQEALIAPSGTGDPMIAPLPGLGPDEVAVSPALATQLGLSAGDGVEIFTQAENRPRQLVLNARVAGVLPPGRLDGRVVMADIGLLDLIEAFYDGYALPEHGIDSGKPLADRAGSFEGMRVYAAALDRLAPLQDRLETRFGVRTLARTAEVTSVLTLGRNLGLALALTVAVAAAGLAASLIFGFWGEVVRTRRTLANLGLLGLPQWQLSLFPVVQALVTAVLGLCVSFLLFRLTAALAERLFETGLTERGGLVSVSPAEALAIAAAVIAFVGCASLAAARAALATDPATVLREET